MALNAGRSIAVSLAKAGLIEESEVEDSAIDIAKYGRKYMDGYALAKALDDYGHWDCNFEMAEELNEFSSAADYEIGAAEKGWAIANSIAAPLPIGDRVVISRSGETGEITGIYEHGPAKFLIKIDGDPRADGPQTSRRIVNFEDVSKEPHAVAETQAP